MLFLTALIRDPIWWFPKIRGTFLGVSIIRTIIFWGLYWVPSILGNYHILVDIILTIYLYILFSVIMGRPLKC